MKKLRVIVIGNGIAGRSAALAAKQKEPDSDVIIITNEGKDTYSACALPFILSGSHKFESIFLPQIGLMKQIKVLEGINVSSLKVDKKCVFTDSGDKYYYDSLVLALGGKPRLLFFNQENIPEGAFCFKTLNDVLSIIEYSPDKICIVGAGLVGVEVAASFAERGKDVTLIEAKSQVLSNVLDDKPAEVLKELLIKNGVNVLTGICVENIATSKNKINRVDIGDKQLECDSLIIAAGIIPNTDLIKQSKVKIGLTGAIRVDSGMRTNIKNIYACGDCAESYDTILNKVTLHPLWFVAKTQGEIAGSNAVGQDSKWPGAFGFTATCLFGVNIVSMGLSSIQINSDDLTVEESNNKRSYKRLIYIKNKLVGAQGLGDLDWMTGLIASIGREEVYDFTKYVAQGTKNMGNYN